MTDEWRIKIMQEVQPKIISQVIIEEESELDTPLSSRTSQVGKRRLGVSPEDLRAREDLRASKANKSSATNKERIYNTTDEREVRI